MFFLEIDFVSEACCSRRPYHHVGNWSLPRGAMMRMNLRIKYSNNLGGRLFSAECGF